MKRGTVSIEYLILKKEVLLEDTFLKADKKQTNRLQVFPFCIREIPRQYQNDWQETDGQTTLIIPLGGWQLGTFWRGFLGVDPRVGVMNRPTWSFPPTEASTGTQLYLASDCNSTETETYFWGYSPGQSSPVATLQRNTGRRGTRVQRSGGRGCG